ncbi:MAG: hypothetical protein AAB552_04165 [Patescibacteria group bacterium]
MTTKTLDFNNIEQKLFWIFVGVATLLIAVYLYSAFSVTVNVVERNKMTQATRDIEAKVGTLEAEYMQIQNSITLAYAKNLGLKEVTAKFTTETPSVKFSIVR